MICNSKKLSRFLKKTTRPLLSLLLFYIVIVFFFYFKQTSLIFYPDQTDFHNCSDFANVEKITHKSARGYFTIRDKENLIVYYQGNAGRACDRSYFDSIFEINKYSTFFVEYPGYGETNNRPSKDKILKSVLDVIDFIDKQNFENVILVSESIGSGPAGYHVKNTNNRQNSELHKVDQLLMMTPFNDLASVGFNHFPFLPIRALLRHNFNPTEYLVDFSGQVDIIAAENDRVVPAKFAKKLYDSLNTDQKNFHLIKDVDHNELLNSIKFIEIFNSILQ